MHEATMSSVRRRFVTIAAAATVAMGMTVVATSSPATAATGGPMSTYIVQMADIPATGYPGNVSGYRATKPAAGAIAPKGSTIQVVGV